MHDTVDSNNHDLQSRKYAVAYFKASIYVTEFEAYKRKAQPALFKY